MRNTAVTVITKAINTIIRKKAAGKNAAASITNASTIMKVAAKTAVAVSTTTAEWNTAECRIRAAIVLVTA
jgi:hypothetical protein